MLLARNEQNIFAIIFYFQDLQGSYQHSPLAKRYVKMYKISQNGIGLLDRK